MTPRQKRLNPFLTTRRMAQAHLENHLTEFFAAALDECVEFRQAYADRALRAYGAEQGWGAVEITRVETQVPYPGTSCCPDLRLTLLGSDGVVRYVVAEHKVAAPETLGRPVGETQDELETQQTVGQLERYLSLPTVDGVLYVRESWKTPSAEVMDNPKYIAPTDAPHFLWSHFHGPLKKAAEKSAVVRWLAEGFESLGYLQPHAAIGDLDDLDPDKRERNRQDMKRLWGQTHSRASALGWKVSTGSTIELYLRNSASKAELVWIAPSSGGVRLRVTPKLGLHDQVVECLRKVSELSFPESEIYAEGRARRATGPVAIVDVVTSLPSIMGEAVEVPEIEERLSRFVGAYLESLRD